MFWLNLFLFPLAILGNIHCGHTTDFDRDLQFLPDSPGRSLAQSSTRDTQLKPIRLHLHYLNMNMSPSLESEFRNDLMSTVQNFYQNRLLVYPLKENLKLTGFAKCATVTIPEEHRSTGVSADLMIYVFGNSFTDQTWVARAGACIMEGAPYRNVLAGRIEINTARYTSSISYEDRMQTVIHEIFHILGFSNSLYQYFHKDSGAAYLSSEITSTASVRGKTVTLFKTPTVLSKARDAFGCTTLPGLELEDGGGSGTAGSHWEKRMMFNDFMVGDIGPTDIVYSDITFSLLKDSGWYDINWDYTDTIHYGKDRGCDFYENKCVMNNNAQFPEFCVDDNSTPKCDYLRLYKGYCNKQTLSSSFPEYYKYFSSSNIAGADTFMDYCPTVKGYSNGSCRGIGVGTTLLDTGSGESVSVSSRCFEHNLLNTSYSYTSSFQRTRAGCFSVRCEDSKYYVTVDNTEIQCIPGKRVSYDGYNGKLTCPQYDEVCGSVPCPLACRGVGQCNNGFCTCDSGFGGNDCGIKCHPSCKNCSGEGYNQCTSCNKGSILFGGVCRATLQGGRCPELCARCSAGNCMECVENAERKQSGICECKDGYGKEDGKCVLECDYDCKTCTSNGSTCLSCYENASLMNGECVCDPGFKKSDGKCVYEFASLLCPIGCASCTSSAVCDRCESGYVLWTSVSQCYPKCPSGFITENSQCVQSNDLETVNLPLYNNYFTNSSDSNSMEYLSSNNKNTAFPQGIYFNGDSYTRIISDVQFSNDFYIEILARPDPMTSTSTLFSKVSNETVLSLGLSADSKLFLDIRLFNTTSSTLITPHILSTEISSSQWHKIAAVISYFNSSTFIEFYNDQELLSSSLIENSYFIDDLENSQMYLGAGFNGTDFTEMYKGFIAGLVSKNTADYPKPSRRLRGFQDFFLPNCDFGEAFEDGICKKCPEDCEAGCFRSTDCRLNIDPLCRTFSNSRFCDECIENAAILNGRCKCIAGEYSKNENICRSN